MEKSIVDTKKAIRAASIVQRDTNVVFSAKVAGSLDGPALKMAHKVFQLANAEAMTICKTI